jgi:hypothetical protein
MTILLTWLAVSAAAGCTLGSFIHSGLAPYGAQGRGFEFSERLRSAEQKTEFHGSLVPQQRVAILGGQLAVESAPGRGTRLEITLPRSVHV